MNLNAWEYLLLIVLMAATTVITRSFFFMVGGSRRMPGWMQKSLGYVPAVALSAILAPDLLMAQGALVELFFLYTRHLLGTLVFGMVCYTALRLWA